MLKHALILFSTLLPEASPVFISPSNVSQDILKALCVIDSRSAFVGLLTNLS